MMYTRDLIAIRGRLQITQITLAERLGLTERTLQALEGKDGRIPLRRVNELAVSRVLIDYAIERKDPGLLGDLRPDLQNLIMEDFARLVAATAIARDEVDGLKLRSIQKA